MRLRPDDSLRRLIEEGIASEFGIPKPGLWLSVDRVRTFGRVPHRIEFVATAHFTLRLIPLCCGELLCHFPSPRMSVWESMEEFVRSRLRLRQDIEIEMVEHHCVYHQGVTFHFGRLDDELFDTRDWESHDPSFAKLRNWSY